MLKLEKIAKTRDLNVSLRDKPSLFTKPFLFALSYALFIHFIALCLFHISPFRISYQESIFPPSLVATDIPSSHPNHNISIDFGEEVDIPLFLLAPVPSHPDLPQIAETPLVKTIKYFKQSSLQNNPFTHLEDQIALQPHDSLFADTPINKRLAIYTSGELAANSSLQKNGKLEMIANEIGNIPFLAHNSPHRLIFSVQVEKETGHVFWWELQDFNDTLGHSDSEDLKQLAIAVLKNLQFKFHTQEVVVRGSIEIVLASSQSESPIKLIRGFAND